MVIHYFKDRSESFNDYLSLFKKDKCKVEYVFHSIELFVSMYNDTLVNKNKITMLRKEKLIISQVNAPYLLKNYYNYL